MAMFFKGSRFIESGFGAKSPLSFTTCEGLALKG